MKKIIISLFCIMASLHTMGQNKIEHVDAIMFKKLIDQKTGVLIDLRTDDELKNKGFIKGALQIDYFGKDAEAKISKLDKNKTYLIYCAGGGRSGECADLMKKKGFFHIVNLEKGFDDWKKKGFEIDNRK